VAFVSYKWGTPSEDAWAHDLAGFLGSIGWTIMLDAHRDPVEALSVEEFVVRMSSCRLCVAVLTPSYWHHAVDTRRPSWVYDEIQLAMRLPHVHLLGLVRPPPDDRPPPQPEQPASVEDLMRRVELAESTSIVVTPETDVRFDRVIANTDASTFRPALQRLYGYTGPTLAPAAERKLRVAARRLANADPLEAAHADALQALAGEHPSIGLLWLLLVSARQRLGDPDRALGAARRGAQATPEWDGRLELLHSEIEITFDTRDFAAAFRASVALLDDYPRDWLARHTIGTLFDDIGAPWFARNQLLLAVANPEAPAEVRNTLGVVYLHLGALARAEQCFRETLEQDPANAHAHENLELVAAADRGDGADATEIAGPVLGCTECDAILSDGDEWPCAGCGFPRASPEPCSYCGTEGMAVPPLPGVAAETMCPICRRGTLVTRDSVPL
jgi:Flp pilus assembly protein TadD